MEKNDLRETRTCDAAADSMMRTLPHGINYGF